MDGAANGGDGRRGFRLNGDWRRGVGVTVGWINEWWRWEDRLWSR